MTNHSYTVTGMTCGHCEMSVVEEVEEIPGVHDVTADHTTGSLTFTSAHDISRDDVAAAVQEAGYELA